MDLAVLIPIVAAVVVLLGAGIGVVTVLQSKRKKEATRRWVRGAYSLWTGGEDCGTWTAQRAQSSLASWYGASNVGLFWDVIGDLRRGQTGNPAWDYVRALDLLRIGTAAAFIDEEQCWTEAAKIGRDLQGRYGTWEDLARAFESGMQTWQRSRGMTDPNELNRVQRNLPALRQQIWPSVDFKSELAYDD